MKKSITVPLAIILATVVLSLYQGVHHTITGFDVMLALCIFFLGMLANSGKDPDKSHAKPMHPNLIVTDPDLVARFNSLADEAKNERCENLMNEGHSDGHC